MSKVGMGGWVLICSVNTHMNSAILYSYTHTSNESLTLAVF